jgi:hypothetical protein
MPIYENDKYHMMCIGDYHPVKVMDGDRTIARAKAIAKTGTVLEWSDTYFDTFTAATIQGASSQTVTTQGANLFAFSGAGSIISSNYYQFIARSFIPLIAGAYNVFTLGCAYNATEIDIICLLSDGTSVSRALAYNTKNQGFTVKDNLIWWSSGHSGGANYTLTANIISIKISLYGTIASGWTSSISEMQIRLSAGAVNLAYTAFVPNSPSPDYPSAITSIGDPSGIDFTVTGNAGQNLSVHRSVILRSLLDGTRDEWDAVSGTVMRRVGVKVFDGTEAFEESTYYVMLPISKISPVPVANSKVFCTHFPDVNWNTTVLGCWFGASAFAVNKAGHSAFTSAATAKTWLAVQYAAGTPVTVLYKLATPSTETLAPVPLPTYPHYTRLECSTPVTASARVVDVA